MSLSVTTDQKVVSYQGKKLGQGGFGEIYSSAYVSGDGKTFEFGALKYSRDDNVSRSAFKDEAKGALEIMGWGSVHLIRPLHVGTDFIIYETGEVATDLNGTKIQQDRINYLRLLQEAGHGILEYQKHGKFHSDIKQVNILAIKVGVDSSGKDIYEIKIIDNTPIDYARTQDPDWARTEGYSFDKVKILEARRVLHSQGKKPAEINTIIGRGMDAYAYAKMVKDTLDKSFPGWANDPNNQNLVKNLSMVESQTIYNPDPQDHKNLLKAGQKGLVESIQKELNSFTSRAANESDTWYDASRSPIMPMAPTVP